MSRSRKGKKKPENLYSRAKRILQFNNQNLHVTNIYILSKNVICFSLKFR